MEEEEEEAGGKGKREELFTERKAGQRESGEPPLVDAWMPEE